MEVIVKNLLDKISSYDIYNNLLSGIIFCIIIENYTRISFLDLEFIERIFLYYFIGMVLSRIGSILIDGILKFIKIKNKKSNKKEPFLQFAPYSDYVEASNHDSFISTLSEANNTYRTIIAMLVSIICVKIYDWLLYELINNCTSEIKNGIFIFVFFLLAILFIYSYKKQTDYITKRIKTNIKLNHKEY